MNATAPTDRLETPADSPTGQGSGGEAVSTRDAREARRMQRLYHLEILRTIGMEMAAALGHATAGRTQYNIQAFAKTHDPALAFSRLALAVRQIVALEERLDEDAETRAARISEEQAEQARDAARTARIDRRQTVRRAVREAHSASEPDMTVPERERLLDGLFRNYKDYDDYGGTLAEIVARICADLGVEADMSLWQEDASQDVPPPADEEARNDNRKPDHPRVDPAVWAEARAAFDKKHGILAANDAPRSRGCGPPDG